MISAVTRLVRRLAASNRYYLCKLGVTHVLNAAEGKREKNGTVDTSQVVTHISIDDGW